MRATGCGLLAVVLAIGCSIETIPFACGEDADCVDGDSRGTCEARGFCSFSDDACESGRRFGKLAPDDVAGQCVSRCVASMSAGGFHTCALRADGSVLCWGAGEKGQLGDGGRTSSPTPVEVVGIEDAVAIAAGGEHTCAIDAAGDAWCWGLEPAAFGADGDASTVPARVSIPDDWGRITDVAAGPLSVVVVAGERIGVWGRFVEESTTTMIAPPSLLQGDNVSAVRVTAGGSHACALGAVGAIVCWGFDGFGQLQGDGLDGAFQPVPVPMRARGTRADDVDAGVRHTCSLIAGAVSCWGSNERGQLGIPPEERAKTPQPEAVTPLPPLVEAVDAGSAHACALAAGQIWCWGDNLRGQLGGSAGDPLSSTPVLVDLDDAAVQVVAGAEHTCARTERDEIYCWGRNDRGQLGNGATSTLPEATPDSTITNLLACP